MDTSVLNKMDYPKCFFLQASYFLRTLFGNGSRFILASSMLHCRYHEFKEYWDRQKPPGESDRSALRWQIRVRIVVPTTLYLILIYRSSAYNKIYHIMRY